MPYRKLLKGEARSVGRGRSFQYNIEAVEVKPCHRTIIVSDDVKCCKCSDTSACSGCGHLKYYFLPFPYQVFLRYNNSVALTFSNKSLETLNDPVYTPNLPNQGTNGFVCLGRAAYGLTETTKIEKLIEIFWNTVFVFDPAFGSPTLGSFEKWQERSLVEVLQTDSHYTTCSNFFWYWSLTQDAECKEEFCVLK
jgi:hypothetical protein